jgi:hypothetical protein
VVPDLCRVVEDAALGVRDDIFEGGVFHVRAGEQAIQLVDVGLVVLAVVVFEGLGGNVRLQGVLLVGQGGQFKAMGVSLLGWYWSGVG